MVNMSGSKRARQQDSIRNRPTCGGDKKSGLMRFVGMDSSLSLGRFGATPQTQPGLPCTGTLYTTIRNQVCAGGVGKQVNMRHCGIGASFDTSGSNQIELDFFSLATETSPGIWEFNGSFTINKGEILNVPSDGTVIELTLLEGDKITVNGTFVFTGITFNQNGDIENNSSNTVEASGKWFVSGDYEAYRNSLTVVEGEITVRKFGTFVSTLGYSDEEDGNVKIINKLTILIQDDGYLQINVSSTSFENNKKPEFNLTKDTNSTRDTLIRGVGSVVSSDTKFPFSDNSTFNNFSKSAMSISWWGNLNVDIISNSFDKDTPNELILGNSFGFGMNFYGSIVLNNTIATIDAFGRGMNFYGKEITTTKKTTINVSGEIFNLSTDEDFINKGIFNINMYILKFGTDNNNVLRDHTKFINETDAIVNINYNDNRRTDFEPVWQIKTENKGTMNVNSRVVFSNVNIFELKNRGVININNNPSDGFFGIGELKIRGNQFKNVDNGKVEIYSGGKLNIIGGELKHEGSNFLVKAGGILNLFNNSTLDIPSSSNVFENKGTISIAGGGDRGVASKITGDNFSLLNDGEIYKGKEDPPSCLQGTIVGDVLSGGSGSVLNQCPP
jgi:hypothetical protein